MALRDFHTCHRVGFGLGDVSCCRVTADGLTVNKKLLTKKSPDPLRELRVSGSWRDRASLSRYPLAPLEPARIFWTLLDLWLVSPG
ncbi:hypothetical protein CHARACLAT_017945 [Characodon lateralis]|uniref:Uncharacterized protein n=1 Tax=Characodon lateralis TaxID=208331 RepID=A0ABU7EDH3_9TELE|nr:hypothetical protein [Characodon lateralis]